VEGNKYCQAKSINDFSYFLFVEKEECSANYMTNGCRIFARPFLGERSHLPEVKIRVRINLKSTTCPLTRLKQIFLATC
jgi:hypothetical protein